MNRILSLVIVFMLMFISIPSSLYAHPRGVLADYAMEIREEYPRADGIRHVDTPALINKLKELHVNTYYYLIYHAPTDWDDFKNEFMPAAQEAGIDVIVYLVPPSESAGNLKSYPYTTDYIAWAEAIAELSKQYSHLVGWAIDDFNHNLDFFTPTYMSQMQNKAKAINPNLSFYPVMYYEGITDTFMQSRYSYFDGTIFVYRDDPYRNTQITASLQSQIDQVSSLTKYYGRSLILMVYASKLAYTPANPTPEYIKTVAETGLTNINNGKLDGVVTYCLPKENMEEPADKKAFSGNGYLSMFLPPGVPTQAGNDMKASQIIYPQPGLSSYTLSFYTMDEGPNTSGYHIKQVLIDQQVVWQKDVSSNTADGSWEKVNLDLTPYLKGKTQAVLTFRVFEKSGVSNFWQNAGFDAIQATGFTVNNASFEDRTNWTFSTSKRGMIVDFMIYNPNRQAEAFSQVSNLYQNFTPANQFRHWDFTFDSTTGQYTSWLNNGNRFWFDGGSENRIEGRLVGGSSSNPVTLQFDIYKEDDLTKPVRTHVKTSTYSGPEGEKFSFDLSPLGQGYYKVKITDVGKDGIQVANGHMYY